MSPMMEEMLVKEVVPRLRNAARAQHPDVPVPHSHPKEGLAQNGRNDDYLAPEKAKAIQRLIEALCRWAPSYLSCLAYTCG